MPELRKDPVTGRWVIISAERSLRPSDFPKAAAPARENRNCPFEPGNEAQTPPEVLAFRPSGLGPNMPGWTLRVVPNRFPALTIEGPVRRDGEGMYDRMSGVGAHEVIIETPDHDRTLTDLDEASFRDVVRAWRDRVEDLARDERLKYALVFKNSGRAAGASLEHAHSQLIATPVVPKLVKEELAGSRRYWDFHRRCVFCDMIGQELETGRRIVCGNEQFLAFTPFAPRFPFETWLVARRHFGLFAEMDEREQAGLAAALKSVLERIDRVLGNPDYNVVIHTAPLRETGIPHYHFHVEVMPKKTVVAGFEWGSGFFINPMAPEPAARYLREAER
jgi:UDPglucose--hexose-1-phosphate uridylyltransferase